MEYMRPSNHESIESWVSIWLNCMSCTFSRHGGSANSGMDEDGNVKPNKPHTRVGTSLHQQSCGHGYDAGHAYRFHVPNKWIEGGSTMGGSPRERQSIATSRYLAGAGGKR